MNYRIGQNFSFFLWIKQSLVDEKRNPFSIPRRIPQIQLCLFHTLSYISKLTLCDKTKYIKFLIVNFLFIWTNIPAKPPRGAYISQLILYSRACDSYYDFLEIWLLLIRKLLIQWFLVIKLKSSLWLFYVCNHDLVNGYGIAVSHMATEYLCHTLKSTYISASFH
jgi:hypothetical protein